MLTYYIAVLVPVSTCEGVLNLRWEAIQHQQGYRHLGDYSQA